MTTTEATKADISSEEADVSQGAAAEASQAKAEAAAHKSALRELLAPVRTRTTIAMVMQVIAAVAAIVPYVAIAELGKTLIVGGDIDSSRVWTIVWVVVFGLGMRAFFGGGALIVTHFADVNLQAVLRRRIAATLGRLPLAGSPPTRPEPCEKPRRTTSPISTTWLRTAPSRPPAPSRCRSSGSAT